MAEWSIAAVLKTVEVQASGGSNPSLSATLKSPQTSINKGIAGFFVSRSGFASFVLFRVLRDVASGFALGYDINSDEYG